MTRPPHTQDTAAHWAVVAGVMLLAVVAGIGIGAGPRAGLAAGVILIVVPSGATGLLVLIVLALDAARAIRRHRRAARLASHLTEDG